MKVEQSKNKPTYLGVKRAIATLGLKEKSLRTGMGKYLVYNAI